MDNFKITVDDNLHKLFRKQYSYTDEIRFGAKEVAIMLKNEFHTVAYPLLFDDYFKKKEGNPNWKYKYNVTDRMRYGLILKYRGVKEAQFCYLDEIMYLTIYYSDGKDGELSVDIIMYRDFEKLT